MLMVAMVMVGTIMAVNGYVTSNSVANNGYIPGNNDGCCCQPGRTGYNKFQQYPSGRCCNAGTGYHYALNFNRYP